MLNILRFPQHSLPLIIMKKENIEIVEWADGTRELRVCYWTRKRETERW
jgi:hypothetical protein